VDGWLLRKLGLMGCMNWIDRYDILLQTLGVAAWVRDFRRGRYLSDACTGDHMSAEWYTCPPALIPLTANGSMPAYKGIWTRWFCGDPLRRYVGRKTLSSSGRSV
jgi:hypothetical protein